MLVATDLHMAGYSGDTVPAMQKRMIDAMQTIPGVEHRGIGDDYPPLVTLALRASNVFKDRRQICGQSNAVAIAIPLRISPGYFHAAGTACLAGRDFSWHDDKKPPRVAVVNRELPQDVRLRS